MAQKTLTTSYLARLSNANHDGVTQQIDDRFAAFETDNTMFLNAATAVHAARQAEDIAFKRFSGKDFASDDLKAADRLEDQYMSTVETVAAGDLVGNYPYCLDGDAAPVTIRADKPCTVYVVDGQQLNQHFLQSKEAAQVALQFLNYRFAQLHQHRRQYYFTHQPEDE